MLYFSSLYCKGLEGPDRRMPVIHIIEKVSIAGFKSFNSESCTLYIIHVAIRVFQENLEKGNLMQMTREKNTFFVSLLEVILSVSFYRKD